MSLQLCYSASEGPFPRRSTAGVAAAEIHAHSLRQRAHHIFKDSDIGRFAKKLLEPTERVLKEMNDRQRAYLVRDLRARLGSIATLAELRSTRSSRKR